MCMGMYIKKESKQGQLTIWGNMGIRQYRNSLYYFYNLNEKSFRDYKRITSTLH